jgi:hypothetical protein
MSEEPTTNTNAAPEGAMRKGDWVFLAVVLLVSIPLVLFGYGGMVMGVLGVIMIISFMTMQAVMEERGREDPAVKRMKKLLPLLAVALVPPLVVGLVVDSVPRWLALLPCLAALVVVIWNAHRVEAPVTFRKLLRGAGEKEPGYLDMQLLRNVLLVTIICVIAMLGDSGARPLWDRDAPSIARDAEESLGETRESLATLSAATDELMANMVRITSEAYAEWTTAERHEFLDRIENGGNTGRAWTALLTRLQEVEEDPELRGKIEGMKGEG